MKRVLLVTLAVCLLGLGGCIIIDDSSSSPDFDFNGFWKIALSGCQSQFADAEIFQAGNNFTMVSTYRFDGVCDPRSGDFTARTDGRWGYWSFSGRATGDNTMNGTYIYGVFGVGECTGSFSATRTGFRGAEAVAAPGRGLQRQP